MTPQNNIRKIYLLNVCVLSFLCVILQYQKYITMANKENKNVTISISDDVKAKGVDLARAHIGSNNLSGIISYLINKEYKELYS